MLILALTNCYTVDTGEVAIISTFGKITKVENEGLHVKIPFVQGKTFMETREKHIFLEEQMKWIQLWKLVQKICKV